MNKEKIHPIDCKTRVFKMKNYLISRSAFENMLIKYYGEDTRTYDAAIALTAVQRAPEWVSVEERLPEKDGEYLTASKYPNNENVYIKCAEFCVDGCAIDEYDFDEDSNYYALEYITHWMPL